MVVIREFYPCQREYVYKYAEHKRVEKEIAMKIFEVKAALQIEEYVGNKTIVADARSTRSLISSIIDFESFVKETERHLIEAKQFGQELQSIHNAVQDLNNLSSSELLQRLKAGNALISSRSSCHDKYTNVQEIERYANGTIVDDELTLQKGRTCSPVSLTSLEEYKLHGRIQTPDFQNYHRDKKSNKNHVRDSHSHESYLSFADKSSQCKLLKRPAKEEKIKQKSSCPYLSYQSKQKSPRNSVCPPKVKEMLDKVKQRKCTNNRVALPISVLNLQLV